MSDTQPNTNGSPRYFESEEQTELLKRGLVRVSIAASGIDPLLDKRLNELRRALRSDAPAHLLGELLPDLERAVLTADQLAAAGLEVAHLLPAGADAFGQCLLA